MGFFRGGDFLVLIFSGLLILGIFKMKDNGLWLIGACAIIIFLGLIGGLITNFQRRKK